MARQALGATGVLGGYDLGKLDGLGRVGFVAALAQSRARQVLGREGGRIVGVLRERSVARLARNPFVNSGRPGGGHVIVAGRTGCLSGKCNSPLADIVQRSRTVVSVLAEVLRNQRCTHDEKSSEA